MAEEYGTYDRRGGRRQMHDAEEQELEDEADGLVDQKMPARQPVLPGISGIPLPTASKDATSTGGAQVKAPPGLGAPFPPPPFPGALPPGFDTSKLAELLRDGQFPPPPPLGGPGQGLPPPPPNFDFSKMPPGLFPQGFQPPPGFPPPPLLGGGGAPAPNGLPGIADAGANGGGGAGARRRAPLPSQQESLMEEQRRGKFRTAR